jgi:hypothetical protein
MRFVMPTIIIGIAVSVFFVFTDPIYRDISELRLTVASYDSALNNSKTLGNERDKLTTKLNSINPDNLVRLEKLLPSNVDNIRLILEIEQIASPYGMVLKDIKYNASNDIAETAGAAIQGGGTIKSAPKDYGIFDLEFSTSGSYDNFINFTKDLENNLRIVDISSVSFTSDAGVVSGGSKTMAPEIYRYNFKIKTYWLKS